MNTQTMVDLTQSLGWIINQEKSKLKPTQVFSCHSREMAQTSGFDQNMFFCKMFDVANWVACLNGEEGPGWMDAFT